MPRAGTPDHRRGGAGGATARCSWAVGPAADPPRHVSAARCQAGRRFPEHGSCRCARSAAQAADDPSPGPRGRRPPLRPGRAPGGLPPAGRPGGPVPPAGARGRAGTGHPLDEITDDLAWWATPLTGDLDVRRTGTDHPGLRRVPHVTEVAAAVPAELDARERGCPPYVGPSYFCSWRSLPSLRSWWASDSLQGARAGRSCSSVATRGRPTSSSPWLTGCVSGCHHRRSAREQHGRSP